ncbi:PTS mannose/fructose/sorbose/N-acetylgalactosamine transporter subunit IIC [Clostridium beijerinckii]|uniref:PTS mannose/fructose/sorbose/N-acetylgalactosamine transporter subunit IIC n=1 Tax=Clostridium beijerinckii TaxID=1520 RepID=UPI00149433FC|nr:PTS sugar transporter subunit IIC [Clostridium beijerinckii]NOW05035.1 fructoselysine and glucoselysine-specific PTS system IIC component [Clostridium beijerinckii]NYC01823.1 fructoselysine and glucoselysine-specific PTS system IIC component [Clostridium beijerinckii]
MLQIVLIFLVACFGYSDYFTGKTLQTRPLVLCPLVGLIMGDLQAGCIIGATLELAFMGAVGVGAALLPEVVSGGILGTAFAIVGHKDAGMAVALGLPIAMLVMLLRNFLFIAIVPLFANRADKYALEGDIKGVSRMHWYGGIFGMYLPLAILTALSFYLGSSVMETILNSIPQFIQDGLTISAGILPALGFAILLRMIMNKKVAAFLFIGFVLTAYLKLPVLGVAIMAICVVLVMVLNNDQKDTKVMEAELDEDF